MVKTLQTPPGAYTLIRDTRHADEPETVSDAGSDRGRAGRPEPHSHWRSSVPESASPGSSNCRIAQGSIFRVFGSNLGPSEIQVASTPLLNTSGLAVAEIPSGKCDLTERDQVLAYRQIFFIHLVGSTHTLRSIPATRST